MTNVSGIGAVQLAQSLVPALENRSDVEVTEIYVPSVGALAQYEAHQASTQVVYYRRWLPNNLSRFLECTLFAEKFAGNVPLLVLGDLPLRCSAMQTIVVHNLHLVPAVGGVISSKESEIKYRIAQAVFRRNLPYVHAIIVQTQLMADMLARAYPGVVGKVAVIGQPVPEWLLRSGLQRRKRHTFDDGGLVLFYPAAAYPHKNHQLLSGIASAKRAGWPVKEFILTIDEQLNPAPEAAWIKCIGLLSGAEMVDCYSKADALVFLSRAESYGFPLIEAMFVGLPIICPDLSYARVLCGSEAIYFDCGDPRALEEAVRTLDQRLRDGWWPNWGPQLAQLPKDWGEVAEAFLDVALAGHDPKRDAGRIS